MDDNSGKNRGHQRDIGVHGVFYHKHEGLFGQTPVNLPFTAS